MLFMCVGKFRPLDEAGQQRMLEIYESWKPPDGLKILHHWLAASGGDFVVVEADSPAALGEGIANWAPFIDYEAFPIAETAAAVSGLKQAVDQRKTFGSP